MSETTQTAWKLHHKLSQFSSRTLLLRFQNGSEDQTTPPVKSRNAEQQAARNALVAEFRTGREWQRVERLKTKLMSIESSLSEAKTNLDDAESQYAAVVTGDLPDTGEGDGMFATLESFKREVAKLSEQMTTLRKSLIEAWAEAKAAFDVFYREHAGELVQAAKRAFEAKLDKFEIAVAPLLDEIIAARETWQCGMAGSAINVSDVALGKPPVFRDVDPPTTTVEMNPMRPEPKPAGSKIIGEPVYG